jgi:hypothetical protein
MKEVFEWSAWKIVSSLALVGVVALACVVVVVEVWRRTAQPGPERYRYRFKRSEHDDYEYIWVDATSSAEGFKKARQKLWQKLEVHAGPAPHLELVA